MSRTLARRGISSKENIPPEGQKYGNISAMKERWEQNHMYTDESFEAAARTKPTNRARDSPTLAQLKTQSDSHPEICTKNTHLGTAVFAAQRELSRKHHEAKSKVEGLSGLGGGVSLWPAMDDMRLSEEDTRLLVILCGMLVVATVAIFFSCHGSHITKLKSCSTQLSQFHERHHITSTSQDMFDQQLLTWHLEFIDLQGAIHDDFDMVWSKSSVFDILFFISYVVGIGTLLYLLVNNMFSKRRLTPRAIKVWISLLCVVTVWTILSVYLLICAQGVETATKRTVYQLNNELATLVQSPLDLTKYHSILLYWRTKCLPPTTSGVLSIMGILAVQDVSYYLQYYSLPVLTAICTPIVTIILSLRKVYAINPLQAKFLPQKWSFQALNKLVQSRVDYSRCIGQA